MFFMFFMFIENFQLVSISKSELKFIYVKEILLKQNVYKILDVLSKQETLTGN
jgi:hypothetical protein